MIIDNLKYCIYVLFMILCIFIIIFILILLMYLFIEFSMRNEISF